MFKARVRGALMWHCIVFVRKHWSAHSEKLISLAVKPWSVRAPQIRSYAADARGWSAVSCCLHDPQAVSSVCELQGIQLRIFYSFEVLKSFGDWRCQADMWFMSSKSCFFFFYYYYLLMYLFIFLFYSEWHHKKLYYDTALYYASESV